METNFQPFAHIMRDVFDYWIDAWQRSILYMDVMRRRGNNFIEYRRKCEIPAPDFGYKTIVRGSSLEHPVNFDLAAAIPPAENKTDPLKRPIVVIDPRTGGCNNAFSARRYQEIGKVLAIGHPVYFVVFRPGTCNGQSAHVLESAEHEFLAEVQKRHPRAENPEVLGSLRDGWAMAILGADRPDITPATVVYASPLSCWTGGDEEKMMRYTRGLMGGAWFISFLSDLSNGKFDGSYVEKAFDMLDSREDLLKERYDLYSEIDTRGKSFLETEKWWDGYSSATSRTSHFIAEDLRSCLQQGNLKLDGDHHITLKDLSKPLVIFAFAAEHMAPPMKVLEWICTCYGSLEELRSNHQVMIYHINKATGFLGLYLSSSSPKKAELLENLDALNNLEPGLYEMIVEDMAGEAGISDYRVLFQARSFLDVTHPDEAQQGPGMKDLEGISELNTMFYRSFLSPWVRMWSNSLTAELVKHLNPLRISRYSCSDLNPFAWSFRLWAPLIRQFRRPIKEDNPFHTQERMFSLAMRQQLDLIKQMRVYTGEVLFRSLYGNPFRQFLPGLLKEFLLPCEAPGREG